MQLFYAHISHEAFVLDEGDVMHCTKVLRKSSGDHIHFITGDGNLYEGIIDAVSKREVRGTWRLLQENWGRLNYDLTVAIAPTKNMDRLEWFVEKSIEMGISKIQLILTYHSERKKVNLERLRKIALSATKQSLKGQLVDIIDPIPFKTFIEQLQQPLAIAHCEDSDRTSFPSYLNQKQGPITIAIGPEGDFSTEEINIAITAGATPIHLGSSRLRTETAAVAAVAMVYAHHLK